MHIRILPPYILFQILKERAGNDRYTERGMQTINFSAKAKQIQTEPIKKTVNNLLCVECCSNVGLFL